MMDIYARARLCDKAEAIIDQLQHDPKSFPVLFKAYGKYNLAERASTVLKCSLQKPHAKPDISAFNSLIDAWAQSTRPDALQQAFAVLRLIEEEPKCRELGIQPDKVTFGALLKGVLLKSHDIDDAGIMAEAVLDEMDRLYLAGNETAKPDSIAFTLVMKSCLQAGDMDRAESVMGRMEKSDALPTLRTCHEILRCWSQIGIPEAAERAEQFLARMKLFAITRGSDLKPDTIAYSIVLDAWANLGDSKTAERMWSIYEQMKSDAVSLDVSCYTRLILVCAESAERDNLARAEVLLESMESEADASIRPDYRHYDSVIKGWLAVNDVEKATRILIRKVEAYVKGENLKAKNSPELIDMAIQGWLRIGDVTRATSLAATMQDLCDSKLLPEGPGVDAYRDLLRAWTESDHSEKQANIMQLEDTVKRLEG